MKIPFLKRQVTELEEIKEEHDEIKRKAVKIDKLAAELRDHLKDNNFGQRLYQQMVDNWR